MFLPGANPVKGHIYWLTEKNGINIQLSPEGEVNSGAYTAISRKVIGKYVHATIPKGNMGYVQYTVLDNVPVEPNFVAFL